MILIPKVFLLGQKNRRFAPPDFRIDIPCIKNITGTQCRTDSGRDGKGTVWSLAKTEFKKNHGDAFGVPKSPPDLLSSGLGG